MGAKGAVGVKLPGRDRTKVFIGHHVKLCEADPWGDAPATEDRGMKYPMEEINKDQRGQVDKNGGHQVSRPKRQRCW